MKSRRNLITAISLLIALVVFFVILTQLTSCNRAMVDFTYEFDRAVISLPNGYMIEGNVEKWIDFDGSDMIQVKIDGTWYLTHSSNVVLISE